MAKASQDGGEWMPKSVLNQWQRKVHAFDRLELFAGSINYGGRPLKWDSRPGSLLQAIEDSDAAAKKVSK